MAADTERELTHDELWDDSALVESWNEALEEYQKYHSLAARGEKVPMDEKPTLPELPSKAAALLNGTHPTPAKPAASAKPSTTTETTTTTPGNFIGPGLPPFRPAPAAAAPQPTGMTGLAGLPQALLGATTQDENLRNIMMSWYYAGYHTGLYEGQQRAWAQWQEAQQQDQQQEESAG